MFFTRLVSFVDSSQKESGVPSTTITLGGKVIVIDVRNFVYQKKKKLTDSLCMNADFFLFWVGIGVLYRSILTTMDKYNEQR